jgi:hypothetical protein
VTSISLAMGNGFAVPPSATFAIDYFFSSL